MALNANCTPIFYDFFFRGSQKKVLKLLLTNGIYLLLPGINLVLILEFVSFAIKIDLQQKKQTERNGRVQIWGRQMQFGFKKKKLIIIWRDWNFCWRKIVQNEKVFGKHFGCCRTHLFFKPSYTITTKKEMEINWLKVRWLSKWFNHKLIRLGVRTF